MLDLCSTNHQKIQETGVSAFGKVPNELLLNILQDCMDYETNSRRNHFNRYTRFALIARRVCRLWKEMVDLPSHYHFRTTSTKLSLRISGGSGDGVFDIRLENHVKFQDDLANSKSMLMIDLEVSLSPIDEFTVAVLPPAESEKIRKFLQAVDNLNLSKGRLVDLRMSAPPGEFEDYMLGSIGSLDLPVTRSFTYMEEFAFTPNPAIGLRDLMEREAASMIMGISGQNIRATSLGPSNSIQRICLSASRLDIKLPSLSSVTGMTLIINGRYHIYDLRAFLRPVALHLISLSMGFLPDLIDGEYSRNGRDEEESDGDQTGGHNRSTTTHRGQPTPYEISLPSLERLGFKAEPGKATYLFCFYFRCPKLRQLHIHRDETGKGISIGFPDAPNEFILWPFPALKTLSIDLSRRQSPILFEVFSFPKLEQIRVSTSELYRLSESLSNLSIKNGLAIAPLRILDLHYCNIDILAKFLSIANLEAIQELLISEHPRMSAREDIDKTNTRFVLPKLRHLHVEGQSRDFFEWVLSRIRGGNESVVLSCLSRCEVLGDSIANTGRAMPQVHTLIVKGAPPAILDHSQRLFNLCFNTRRLIFKGIDITWPSDPITSHLELYQSLPQLEEIILEFERFSQREIPNGEIREMVNSWLSGACNKINTSDRPRATSLKSITVRMHSDYEPSYVEEYPWHEGIVLRLEMIGQA